MIVIDASDLSAQSVMVDEPAEYGPIVTRSAEDVFADVLRTAGASLPRRDPLDQRIIQEVRAGQTTFGNGIISSQTQVEGWPQLLSTQPPEDSDADGMPDTWEREHSENGDLSLQSGLDHDGDGYTNVEEYLNRTDPTRPD